MKVGVSGHQEREGIDWDWVSTHIELGLSALQPIAQALSSLAIGSDQVFTEAAIHLGIPFTAVIPLHGYAKFFKDDGLRRYKRLLGLATNKIELDDANSSEKSFLKAGRYIVDNCDMLFAIWDGKEAEGKGGTGDIVHYALKTQKSVTHINPIKKSVLRL